VYCKDSKCSVGCVDAPFNSGQCLVGGVGASAKTFTCLSSSSTTVSTPGCDRCQVSYHSDSTCRISDPFSRSIVDVPMGLCQVESLTSSWIVFGNSTNAAISYCSDMNCEQCKPIRTVSPNECFSNGGSNLRVKCGRECLNNEKGLFPVLEIIDLKTPLIVSAFPVVTFTDTELENMPFDFKATYFSSSACSSTDSQSTVIAQQRFCQQSGGRSYQVFCDELSANGTVIFYSDQLCALDANKVFFADGQCLASSSTNDIDASGVAWQCLTTKNTQIAPPVAGRCAVSFFELEDCKGNDRSIVNVVSGICQVDGERSWMILSNETDATAVIAWCDDSMCQQCPMTTNIARDQCIGSNGEGPSGPGSRGVRAVCGNNMPPPNIQAVTPTLPALPQSPTSKPLQTNDPYAVRPRRPSSPPSPAPVLRGGPAVDPYAVRPRRPSSSPSPAPVLPSVSPKPPTLLGNVDKKIDPYNVIPKRRPSSTPSSSSAPTLMPSPSLIPSAPNVGQPPKSIVDPYVMKPNVVGQPKSIVDPYVMKPNIVGQPKSIVDPYVMKPNVGQPKSIVDPYIMKPIVDRKTVEQYMMPRYDDTSFMLHQGYNFNTDDYYGFDYPSYGLPYQQQRSERMYY